MSRSSLGALPPMRTSAGGPGPTMSRSAAWDLRVLEVEADQGLAVAPERRLPPLPPLHVREALEETSSSDGPAATSAHAHGGPDRGTRGATQAIGTATRSWGRPSEAEAEGAVASPAAYELLFDSCLTGK